MAHATTKRRIRSRLIGYPLTIVGTVAVALLVVGWPLTQPTFRSNDSSTATADPQRLRAHVVALSETFHPRDWRSLENLDKCAAYIAGHFEEAGAEVEEQVFEVQGREYLNIIGRFGIGRGNRLVVGAHYDAHDSTPGADDNASGVAAMLELARLLGSDPPGREVELVAYTLEEPPFYQTEHMGSVHHARALAESDADVAGVIVLEMVGCFSDEPGSQSYPSPLLHLFYPGRGDFVAVVGRWDQGDWIRQVKGAMVGRTALPTRSLRAPASVPGVDFSDHRSYWPHNIPAVMITDTAFYRNGTYHIAHDTPDTLDYERMAQVTVAVLEAVRGL